jgi:predicted enzyme related to lactoylglutathione lyase
MWPPAGWVRRAARASTNTEQVAVARTQNTLILDVVGCDCAPPSPSLAIGKTEDPTMSVSDQIHGTYGTMYYVQDMKKACAYYKEVLGLKPHFESDSWSEFDLKGTSLCLHGMEPGQKSDGKGIVILKVTGLKTMVDTLKNSGVEFVQEIKQVCEDSYCADFKDPSGNIVSLHGTL